MEHHERPTSIIDLIKQFIAEEPDITDKDLAKKIKRIGVEGIRHYRNLIANEADITLIQVPFNRNHLDRIFQKRSSQKKIKVEIEAEIEFRETGEFDVIIRTLI